MSAAQEPVRGLMLPRSGSTLRCRPGQGFPRGSQERGGCSHTYRLQQLRPRLVIMEASGVYGPRRPLGSRACQSRGEPTPGPRLCPLPGTAKTDRIDAEVITALRQAADVEPRPLPSRERRVSWARYEVGVGYGVTAPAALPWVPASAGTTS